MKEIKAVIQPSMLTQVLQALRAIEGLPAATATDVRGIDPARSGLEKMTKFALGGRYNGSH